MTDQHPDQSNAPVPPDFRALCAKVIQYNEGRGEYNFSYLDSIDRENAAFDAWQEISYEIKHALAQPVPTPGDNHPVSPESSPANDEMAGLATTEMVRRLRTKAATEKANRCHYSAKLLTRAADLLERLSPPQPELEEPTNQEIQEWADACSEVPPEELDPEVHGWRRCFTSEEFSETIRAALARWGNNNTSRSN